MGKIQIAEENSASPSNSAEADNDEPSLSHSKSATPVRGTEKLNGTSALPHINTSV